jgi:hypothetical protein
MLSHEVEILWLTFLRTSPLTFSCYLCCWGVSHLVLAGSFSGFWSTKEELFE